MPKRFIPSLDELDEGQRPTLNYRDEADAEYVTLTRLFDLLDDSDDEDGPLY